MSETAQSATLAPNRAIARQAIVDASHQVFGYELFDRSLGVKTPSAYSDAKLLFNALSLAESDTLAISKTIFINCTHESLAGGHLELIAPERVVLEIPPLPPEQGPQIPDRLPSLQELRRKGFRMAFDQSVLTPAYASWLPMASFIKLDMQQLTAAEAQALILKAQTLDGVTVVAEKVETPEQFELASALGVPLFQGYWFEQPVMLQGQTIRPAQAVIIQLIDLIRKQATTAEIEEVLKHDSTLSFNLLRFINSAGFGARTEVTSFRHAVMLLGLNRLFKWAALLMTTSRAGDTPAALGTTAVVRGRLMELLAQEAMGPEEADNAFVTGVFSLLDAMLGMPMQAALAAVSLPAEVTDALLHKSGPLAPLLELTVACETGDDEAFARAANALGLTSQQINWAHLQALAWAETLAT
jgi:c-di-GMP-related signal transduction protein